MKQSNVWKHLVMSKNMIAVLSGTWLVFAVALEILTRQPRNGVSISISIAIALCEGVAIMFVLAALMKQLLDIINGQRMATLKDLVTIGFAYFFVISAFGTIYLAIENAHDKAFIFTNDNARTPIIIVDYLYLSGITIATVGYGDIVPAIWTARILAVLEAVTGLWLTVTVLGVFIGSLLSRQLQDKQTRFFRDFQSDYVRALADCQATIASLDELSLDECLAFRRNILGTISRLVRLEYEPVPSATVRANWMRFYPANDIPKQYSQITQFIKPDLRREDLKGVLVLKEWDEKPPTMPGKDELALPVYQDEIPQLPGAPESIAAIDGYVVVSDVSKIDLSGQPPEVEAALQQYFTHRAQDIRSFASVRVGDENNPSGVINVQSDDLDLCGTSPDAQQLLVDMIRPFATYLQQVGDRVDQV
jgi:potassium channel LctB